jgi:nucleoid DNA-binding protein
MRGVENFMLEKTCWKGCSYGNWCKINIEGGRMADVTAKKIFRTDVNKSVREKLSQKRLNREEAKEITDTVLDIIRENLEQGNDVFLEGFGAFRIKERKARNRWHKKKKKNVMYPPKSYVFFVPSKRLEKAVKGFKQDENASGKEGMETAVKGKI